MTFARARTVTPAMLAAASAALAAGACDSVPRIPSI